MRHHASKPISRSLAAGLAVAAAVVLFGGIAGVATDARAQTGPNTVTLQFVNLAVLDEAADGHYEGWAIVDGAPISTGNFNVNADGQPVALGTGELIDEFDAGVDISSASDIKISLEPPEDADPAPSGLIVLGGMVNEGQANLATGLEAVAMTTGSFILATPSDNDSEPDNDNQGIWFLAMPGPVPGFVDLPDIGPNWVYEGWAVDLSGSDPMPYSTGTFTMAEGFDSDMAGPMGGGPPFPGQDFVAYQGGPVLDLASGDFAAVISIEPVPDNSPAPFQFKPLAAMIPTDAVGMNNALNNQTESTFPSGLAVLGGSVAAESTSWSAVKRTYR
jgi:hypothetical protein